MSAEDGLSRIEALAAELQSAAAAFAAEPEIDDAQARRLGTALHGLHDTLDILEPLADSGDPIDDE